MDGNDIGVSLAHGAIGLFVVGAWLWVLLVAD
jgi:hypothetical protein